MTKVHAKIRIRYDGCEGYTYYWTAKVLGVDCEKPLTHHKTTARAKRAAIRWCKRLGLTYTITVDKDIER